MRGGEERDGKKYGMKRKKGKKWKREKEGKKPSLFHPQKERKWTDCGFNCHYSIEYFMGVFLVTNHYGIMRSSLCIYLDHHIVELLFALNTML